MVFNWLVASLMLPFVGGLKIKIHQVLSLLLMVYSWCHLQLSIFSGQVCVAPLSFELMNKLQTVCTFLTRTKEYT